MSNNKARKYTSSILEELMSEITPEEMKATEQKMLQELNKQSSIEWLEQALEGTILTHEQIMQTIGLFEQAKAMHKEEMEHFFKMGMSLVEGRLWKPIDKFEEAYNETFGSQTTLAQEEQQ